MTESSTTSLRRLLSRSNSVARGQHVSDPVSHQPGLLDSHSGIVWPHDDIGPVSADFVTGCSLLRVTRKKACTRIFTINEITGVVAIDDVPKFSVDAIRDIRTSEDASHYRELCKIAAEHEPRWLSIVYFLEGTKLKVLHVVCPDQETKTRFRQSLLRLHYQRARMSGVTDSLFVQDQAVIDEHMWYTLLPSGKSISTDASNASVAANSPHSGSSPATRRNMQSRLSFAEVKALCTRLHFNPPESYLLQIFKEVDIEDNKSIDFPAFKRFVGILKTRQEIIEVYNRHRGGAIEMTRAAFIGFLRDVQGLKSSDEALCKVFERAREPTSQDDKESISATNFAAYILSRHNSLLYKAAPDMSRPLNEYFVSSSHNTYLTGRQVGDESSIEPYIRVLQKGCRCIEIDIWSNSDGAPEVRHGRAFTSAVSLESVLKTIDKYAFIVSPWPLIISLEIRCSTKAQGIVADLLTRIFGDVLLLTRLSTGETHLPSPADMRHRILLKVKSTGRIHDQLRHLECRFEHGSPVNNEYISRSDGIFSSAAEDSSVSTSAPDSDFEISSRVSRASSISSRSSSYSNSASPIYRSFGTKSSAIIDDLIVLAPYLKGIKFRNFSLPESKAFNHIFSLSERTIKHFNKETMIQVQKHNTRFMMRVYPSQTRLMSSNFLPHHYWQQGVQMVAMNCQTHDAGQRMNEAFFASDDHSADTTGYLLKPAHMLHWEKGQDLMCRKWKRKQWTITVISGSQLPKGQSSSGKISPCAELEIYRPLTSSSSSTPTKSSDRAREVRFKTKTIEDNSFNPRFDTKITFATHEDEDPYFIFLQFLVRDTVTNDVLGQCFVPLHRLQQGYRSVALYDGQGERFIFSSLFVRVSHTTIE